MSGTNDMSDLNAALGEAGLAHRLTIDAQTVERIRAFLELRKRWSRTHNLAGPRAQQDPWRIDVVDSLAVAACVASELPLVDVGAGSGTPGMLIAIAHPTLSVHLVEPLTKRIAFLRTAAHRLGLSNISIHRSRWPLSDAAGAGLTARFQVVSRAVVSPEDWPELAALGGSSVHMILRCLAAHRPGFNVAGFSLDDAVDYDLGTSGQRRIERWRRVADAQNTESY